MIVSDAFTFYVMGKTHRAYKIIAAQSKHEDVRADAIQMVARIEEGLAKGPAGMSEETDQNDIDDFYITICNHIMMHEELQELVELLYDILEDLTPYKSDCL